MSSPVQWPDHLQHGVNTQTNLCGIKHIFAFYSDTRTGIFFSPQNKPNYHAMLCSPFYDLLTLCSTKRSKQQDSAEGSWGRRQVRLEVWARQLDTESLALEPECLTQETAHPSSALVAPPVKWWWAQHLMGLLYWWNEWMQVKDIGWWLSHCVSCFY